MFQGLWYSRYRDQTITVSFINENAYMVSGEFGSFTVTRSYLLSHILKYNKYERMRTIGG